MLILLYAIIFFFCNNLLLGAEQDNIDIMFDNQNKLLIMLNGKPQKITAITINRDNKNRTVNFCLFATTPTINIIEENNSNNGFKSNNNNDSSKEFLNTLTCQIITHHNSNNNTTTINGYAIKYPKIFIDKQQTTSQQYVRCHINRPEEINSQNLLTQLGYYSNNKH